MIYADDIQLYLSFDSLDRTIAIERLESCVADVKSWAINNKLKCNDAKTEVIHITSRFRRYDTLLPIKIGDAIVQPIDKARNLGVMFDKHLNLRDHVRKMVRSGWHGVRKIGQLRKYLDRDLSEKLVHMFITSHLDCCNSLLTGLPISEISKLQRIQNASARLITLTKRREHISPILYSLHWLPVSGRIDFKIMLLMYKCSIGQAPSYLTDLTVPYVPTRSLRSSAQSFRPGAQGGQGSWRGNQFSSTPQCSMYNTIYGTGRLAGT